MHLPACTLSPPQTPPPAQPRHSGQLVGRKSCFSGPNIELSINDTRLMCAHQGKWEGQGADVYTCVCECVFLRVSVHARDGLERQAGPWL